MVQENKYVGAWRSFVGGLALTALLGACALEGDLSGIPASDVEFPDDDADDPSLPPMEPTPPEPGPEPEPPAVDCGFDYALQFGHEKSAAPGSASERATAPEQVTAPRGPMAIDPGPVVAVAHPEPAPPYLWRAEPWLTLDGVTLPGYTDNMPLFARATSWDDKARCYETPDGGKLLSEAEAYELYIRMAEQTTGVAVDRSEGHRSVVGIRGAYPGTFQWHGNRPNQFNDTLVLLYRENGKAHVREYPVNTDTGAVFFGYESASSLRPNRHYRYINGWHRKYNAPQMAEWGYRVADDSNGNGHWDRDRNGWLSGGALDYERKGTAHNIHMASVNGPLGEAKVKNWSAGCQVIPGMANWLQFIEQAWTGKGDGIDYFLLDARDLDARTWSSCQADGSHACPFRIESFPFVTQGNTQTTGQSSFDSYNCSDANEAGPELVYAFTVAEVGKLQVEVDCPDGVDIDIHLLDGDDPNACLARDHTNFGYDLSPGRYLIVADSFVDDGTALAGGFELRVNFQPSN